MITHEKLPVGLDTIAMDPLTQEEQHFNLPPRKERAQLTQILEVLARIQSVGEADFLGYVRRQAVHLSWGATIILITNQDSEPLLHTLLWLKQTGFYPALILVRPERARRFTTQLQFPIYELWDERELEALAQAAPH
jgi:uncharacterized protein (DUF58 family)